MFEKGVLFAGQRMSKYTKRGRAELEAKTLQLDVKAYFDGHRVAFADRHQDHGVLRTFCKNTFTVPVSEMLTEPMRKRVMKPSVLCSRCEAEIARLERLRYSDPVAYKREIDWLFVEGRSYFS